MIGLEDVRAAAARLRGVASVTPVLTSRTLDETVGATVFLKAEVYQRGGAFKIRGAYNRIACLSPAELARGVVAFSSGNHAQAVAIAAGMLGAAAVIVMPRDAPSAKLAATRGYGAEIVTFDRETEDREAVVDSIAAERGLVIVRPYDDPLIMAGQGTATLELLEEVPPLDHLIVPVGGGGLIAGSATVAKAMMLGIRVTGVEPAAADDTARSFAAGRRVRIPPPATIADGLQVDMPGELTFEVNRRLVDGIATVSEDEIVDAMVFLFDRMKVVVEPSGAVAVAALLAGRVDGVTGRRVGAILSGGNVSAARFAGLVTGRGRAAPGE
ncbi:MAG TPA: pyridoxal-phosphate dependent enzyme [Actinomycetota bacterium]|nr:pyridoxal-phosphate dependent enzyme [Actinomycetota bacterium]